MIPQIAFSFNRFFALRSDRSESEISVRDGFFARKSVVLPKIGFSGADMRTKR